MMLNEISFQINNSNRIESNMYNRRLVYWFVEYPKHVYDTYYSLPHPHSPPHRIDGKVELIDYACSKEGLIESITQRFGDDSHLANDMIRIWLNDAKHFDY